MNKKNAQDITNDVLIADALIRIKALENILISKGILTVAEFNSQCRDIAELLSLSILEKAGVPDELNKIIEEIK
jgi:hypothetical protein